MAFQTEPGGLSRPRRILLVNLRIGRVAKDILQAIQISLQLLDSSPKTDNIGNGQHETLHQALKCYQHANAESSVNDSSAAYHQYQQRG